MNMKKALLVGILALFAGLVLWLSLGRCNDAGDPYGGSSAAIKAWYDETWLASGFYRLERTGVSDDFHYTHITTTPAAPTPTTATNPTFIEDSSNPSGTNNISGASLPQDLVITEWKVTGHVHFTGM